jgi:hypothetical protein
MLVYDNGKSAVRVMPGALPASVHKWTLPPAVPSGPPGALASRTALADPRHLDVRAVLPCSDPCVLHYRTWRTRRQTPDARRQTPDARRQTPDARHRTMLPHYCTCSTTRSIKNCAMQRLTLPPPPPRPPPPPPPRPACCGFSWFSSKYLTLGRFADAWFNGRLPIQPSFHLDSRDAVMAAAGAAGEGEGEGGAGGGDGSASRRLYSRQVLFAAEGAEGTAEGGREAQSDEEPGEHAQELQRQLLSGVCVRLRTVQTLLAADGDGAGSSGGGGGGGGSGGGASATVPGAPVGTSAAAAKPPPPPPPPKTAGPGAAAAPFNPASAALALALASGGARAGAAGGGATAAGAPAPGSTNGQGGDTANQKAFEKSWLLSSIAQNYL